MCRERERGRKQWAPARVWGDIMGGGGKKLCVCVWGGGEGGSRISASPHGKSKQYIFATWVPFATFFSLWRSFFMMWGSFCYFFHYVGGLFRVCPSPTKKKKIAGAHGRREVIVDFGFVFSRIKITY